MCRVRRRPISRRNAEVVWKDHRSSGFGLERSPPKRSLPGTLLAQPKVPNCTNNDHDGDQTQKLAFAPRRVALGTTERTAPSAALPVRPVCWRRRLWIWRGRWVRVKWIPKIQAKCESSMPTVEGRCPTQAVEVGAVKQAFAANPTTELCFAITPELKRYNDNTALDTRITTTMVSVLENNMAEDCCFQLALLNQCRTEKQASALDHLVWGPADNDMMAAQAASFTRLTGRAIQVFEIDGEGLTNIIDTGASARSSFKPIQILVVHVGKQAGRWQRHAVPFVTTPRGSILEKYKSLARACAVALGFEAAEQLTEMLRQQHLAESVDDSDRAELNQAHKKSAEMSTQTDAPREWFRIDQGYLHGMGADLDLDEYPQNAWEPTANDDSGLDGSTIWTQISCPTIHKQMRWVPYSDHSFGNEFARINDGVPEGGRHLRPLADFFSASSGWAIGALLNNVVGAPDIALATVENVRRYGSRTLYCFTKAVGKCVIRGKPDYCLARNDRLQGRGGRMWTFRKAFIEHHFSLSVFETYELVLDSSDVSGLRLTEAILLDTMPHLISNPLSNAVVIESCRPLPDSIANNVYWRLEHQTETDPGIASLLAYARTKAAAGEDLPAQQTARLIRANARAFKGALVGFGGSYDWGFCYGCGSEERGKYEMRLCKDCRAGKMSLLGRAIADGEEVATHANPIVYPNFVTRNKTHPPLKAGIQTRECDSDGNPLLGGNVRVYSEKKKKQLTYSQISGMVRPGKGPWGAGILLDGATPFITSGGTQPLVEAILFRVFKSLKFPARGTLPERPRTVNPAAFENATKLARSQFLLEKFLTSSPTVMRIIDYIMSNPNPARRRALLEAWRLWDERGEHSSDWDEINAFVKQENLPYFAPKNGVLNPTAVRYVARLIQAPSDESHLVAGRYIKPLMKELKACWNVENWIFYGSAEPETLDRWLARITSKESFFWSDYSAFDSTFSDHTWDMIEGFYRQIYPDAEEDFWEVMSFWRRPKGRMIVRADNTRVEYDAEVCNCSGRDDTALANALFNGVALSMAFAAALSGKTVASIDELDLERASELCTISIMGDDSLVGCDFQVEKYADRIVDGLEEFGLIVKAEHSRCIDHVTYLGMMPYGFADGTYQWGPTLGRRLYKMFWMKDLRSPASWVRGVAEQGKLWQNVPLLPELCERIQELLKGKSITKEKSDPIKPWHTRSGATRHWTGTTVQLMTRRYPELTKEMVIEDLLTIKKINRLPCVVRLRSLEVILQHDDL